MASARKRQDEKHLKILRELASLPANKQCFDCHQRGPTYVNMTVGSYVCTSCSGMLRGLTPPHRVKSISMASFSPEEVDLMKARGNEYCKRIWLGLYDAAQAHETKDEQQIKDFMVAKYEKKRYYLDPAMAVKNGSLNFSPPGTQSSSRTSTPTPGASAIPEPKPLSSLFGTQSKPLHLNVQASQNTADNMFTPEKSSNEFLADFGTSDPFSSSSQFTPTPTGPQPSFANFDDNPIFNASSMPTAAALSTMANSSSFTSPSRNSTSSTLSSQPPPEDRYAALKDLDCLMKTQQVSASDPQLSDWSAASTASPWSVNNGPPVGSVSVYGSPSQAGFMAGAGGMQSAFSDSGVATANPFTGQNTNPWMPVTNGISNGPSQTSSFGANPFRAGRAVQPAFSSSSDGAFGWGPLGTNGMPNSQVPNGVLPAFHPSVAAAATFPTSRSMNFPAKTWHTNSAGNPFVVGASPAPTGHSSNPFL